MSSLIAKATTLEYETAPEGVYVARCYRILDLGTQPVMFQGEAVKPRRKVVLFWELLDGAKMKDGRPFSISRTYTLSLDEKALLCKDLQAWRGKTFTPEEKEGFDIEVLLGKYCQIQVVHNVANNTTYANANAIMATKASPEGVNELSFFDINKPDQAIFDALHDYWKEKIEAAPEWKMKEKTVASVMQGKPVTEISDSEIDLSEIPF